MANVTRPVLSVQAHDRAIVGTVLCPQLNHETTQQLERELQAALDAAPGSALVLDLANVEFVPSLGLGMLVRVHKNLKQAGRACVLAAMQPLVLEAVTVTGLDKFFVIRATVEEELKQG